MGSALLTALAVAAMGCSSGGSGGAASAVPQSATDSATSTAAPATPFTQTGTTSTATLSVPSASSSTASNAPTTSTPSPSDSVAPNSGSYLKTLLPSANWAAVALSMGPALPAGWTAHTDESDSGPAPTAPAPSLVGDGACDYLLGKDDDLDAAGGLSVATASESLGNGTAPVHLAFYAYRPGDAAKSLAQVRANATTTCDGFTAMMLAGHVDVKVSATPVGGLGDEALLIKILPQGPYISEENLLVRRGNLMMSLSANDVWGDLPDLTPAAATLVTGMG